MKSILITGCSSGIGLYCAKALQQAGYQVFATVRKNEDVSILTRQGINCYRLDLDSSESIDAALTWVLSQTNGRLDALFNNGAYGQPGAVEDLSRQVLCQQFETNVFGWHELTCKVLKVMRKQGHGRIIQNSSVLGLIALKYRGAYNASKFALEGLTDTLRLELHGSHIYISLIEPGPIESQFRINAFQRFQDNIDIDNSSHKAIYKQVQQRLAQTDVNVRDPFTLGPEAVYQKLLHALEAKKPKARYYVTKPTYIFGFLRRILPTPALDWLLRKVADKENK